MTTRDLGLCSVCKTRLAIGIVSTLNPPTSAAYCWLCAHVGADPESTFEHWEDDNITPGKHRNPDYSRTFKNGKYVSYRDWYNVRH